MAVSTEQLKISLVGFPVLQSTTQDVMTVLGPMFFGGVNVVDIEASKVIKATANALTAKGFHDFELALPFSFLMNRSSMFIPVITLTVGGAVSCKAFLSALPAFTIVGPAMGEITFFTAILSSAVSDAIGMHGKCLSAIGADNCHGWCSHGMNLSKYLELFNTRYFDIACERIAREYAQLKLFPTQIKTEAVQLDLIK
jgi:hypothetical protein